MCATSILPISHWERTKFRWGPEPFVLHPYRILPLSYWEITKFRWEPEPFVMYMPDKINHQISNTSTSLFLFASHEPVICEDNFPIKISNQMKMHCKSYVIFVLWER